METPQSYKDMSIFSKQDFLMNGKGPKGPTDDIQAYIEAYRERR